MEKKNQYSTFPLFFNAKREKRMTRVASTIFMRPNCGLTNLYAAHKPLLDSMFVLRGGYTLFFLENTIKGRF